MALCNTFHTPVAVSSYKNFEDLILDLKLSSKDLLVTEERVFQNFLTGRISDCRLIVRDSVVRGPNTEDALKDILDKAGSNFQRVIGIGGGAVMDLAKLLTLERVLPLKSIYEGGELKKVRKLILVPTTPGTGAEVLQYVAVYLKDLKEQLILNSRELFADEAWLCPQLLANIPFTILAASMQNAFTHAFESFLSPRATVFSRALAEEAMKLLVQSWLSISHEGVDAINHFLPQIQSAGTLSGISYANAGGAAVHALSYPLLLRLGLSRGAANYHVFKHVADLYRNKQPNGALAKIEEILSPVVGTSPDTVFDALDEICQTFLPRKRLSELGMTEDQILEFTDIVLTRQNFLMTNTYVPLSAAEIADIYRRLF